MLVILYGPSCVGKTSIQKGLIESDCGAKAVRCFQTREPRDSDVGRVHVSQKEYDDILIDEEIAISNQHFGNYYGTSKRDLDTSLNNDQLFVLDFLIKDRALLDPYNQKKVLIVPDSLNQVLSQMNAAGRSSRREQIIEDYKKHYVYSHLKKLEREGFFFLRNSHKNVDRAINDLRDYLK
jgi:guanylate kinase